MNILLFGKGGQVGWELQRSLSVLGTVTALDFDSTDHCGDFANPSGVADTVRALRPDVIVNAAAHTAVDKAESEPDLARTLNATAPGAIALARSTILTDGILGTKISPPCMRMKFRKTKSTPCCSLIQNRVMRGSVIGRWSAPSSMSRLKKGMTDPREPTTLP